MGTHRVFGAILLLVMASMPQASEARAQSASSEQHDLGAAKPNLRRTVAITVDDLPFVSGVEGGLGREAEATAARLSNHKLLLSLARHHVPVTGLVNQRGVDELGVDGQRVLRAWIDRGFDLGNHTYSHPDFDDLSVEQFEDEIERGEAGFLPLMQAAGRQSKFFRFPFNHTGDTKQKRDAVTEFLKVRGYRTAPCTIETEDWLFNATYARAHRRRDEAAAARVREAYLAFAAKEIDYFTSLNQQVLGYEPPHILLIHDNPLNADVMDSLIELLVRSGYRFVSLTEAESDPIYQAPETVVTSYGPMWAYRWARERGRQVDGSPEPEAPAWIKTYGEKSEAKSVQTRRPRTAF